MKPWTKPTPRNITLLERLIKSKLFEKFERIYAARSFVTVITTARRSQWPRGLRRTSAAARLLRLWVRIPPGAWIFVCCKCCVLSGRGLYGELITRPEESYRRCVWSRNLVNDEAMAHLGLLRQRQTNKLTTARHTTQPEPLATVHTLISCLFQINFNNAMPSKSRSLTNFLPFSLSH